MAALVQSRSPASASGLATTIADTFASSVVIGNTICVRVRIANAASASTLTLTCADNLGNTYTRQVQTGALPDDRTRIAFFTAPVTTGGSCTVTITVGAAVDRREILIEEVSGLDNASLVAEALAATGSGTAPSAGLLTLAGGGYLMSGFAADQGYRSGSVGSGWTSVSAAAIWNFTLYGRRFPSSGGDYAADFTVSPSDSWVAIGLALNDGAPPPDTTAPTITSTGTGPTNGPFAVNVAENSTAVAITLTSDEALGTVTKGGADGALFTLAGSGLTRTLAPTAALDLESLPHANPFVVTLDFPDTATPTPNTRTVTVNFTVTNVSEPPLAPTIGTATPGNATASVAFTPPSNTGRPAISGYTATSSPGGITGTGASSPITVSGLTNGTAYTFTVTATNADGTGPASAASNLVTPSAGGTAPSISSQPSSQTVTAGAAATFSVSATGTGTLTYQWRRNGTSIGGATSVSYTTPATTVSGGSANNGDLYSVVVSGDTAPPATSSNATLTVNAPGVTTYTAQTDVIAVSGIPLAGTLVHYTWCPAGRPGGITAPVNSTATTNAEGRATISHTVAGDGFVIIGTRPGPVVANDRVFGQFLTLA